MKKRRFALFSIAVLSAILPVVALAADRVLTAPGSQHTTVTAEVAVRYTVTIPEIIDVVFNAVDTPFDISVSDAMLNPRGKVIVTAEAAGRMLHTSGEGFDLSYTIQDEQGKALDHIEFTDDGKKTCRVHIEPQVWKKARAGAYVGVTTFEVTYHSGEDAGSRQ